MPSPNNLKAVERFKANRFSVVRPPDMAIFINGLPVATFDLADNTRLMDEADMDAHVAKPIDFPRLSALIPQLHGQRRDAVCKAG